MDTIKKVVDRQVAVHETDLRAYFMCIALRSILKYVRTKRTTVTYLELARILGVFSGGMELAQLLGTIAEQDIRAGDVPLSTLAVRKSTDMPGEGYFEYLGKQLHVCFEGVDVSYPDPAFRRRFWDAMSQELYKDGLLANTGAYLVVPNVPSTP